LFGDLYLPQDNTFDGFGGPQDKNIWWFNFHSLRASPLLKKNRVPTNPSPCCFHDCQKMKAVKFQDKETAPPVVGKNVRLFSQHRTAAQLYF